MRGLALTLLVVAMPAMALDLPFPAPAELLAEVEDPGASVMLATGNWTGTSLPQISVDGFARQRAWRMAGEQTTLSVMEGFAAALAAAGYSPVHACAARSCGGFDFRFALPLLPEPFMHVDLGDYRYLSARKGEQAVAVMVSRSSSAVYVELTEVGPEGAPPLAIAAPQPQTAPPTASPTPEATNATGGIVARMQAEGAVALDDLAFASGAGALVPGDYASLEELAAWLVANPAARVVLVGHSDASGGLEPNLALSRQRAEAVRAALIARPGVSPAQVLAEGVGALAPRASNETEEGRRQNRRVEAMIAPTR